MYQTQKGSCSVLHVAGHVFSVISGYPPADAQCKCPGLCCDLCMLIICAAPSHRDGLALSTKYCWPKQRATGDEASCRRGIASDSWVCFSSIAETLSRNSPIRFCCTVRGTLQRGSREKPSSTIRFHLIRPISSNLRRKDLSYILYTLFKSIKY